MERWWIMNNEMALGVASISIPVSFVGSDSENGVECFNSSVTFYITWNLTALLIHL
jgi:hypothetical protein